MQEMANKQNFPNAKHFKYKQRGNRLQYRTVRNEYHIKLSPYASDFLQSLEDLDQEGVVREELVHRMARKEEKFQINLLQQLWDANLLSVVGQLDGGMKSFGNW